MAMAQQTKQKEFLIDGELKQSGDGWEFRITSIKSVPEMTIYDIPGQKQGKKDVFIVGNSDDVEAAVNDVLRRLQLYPSDFNYSKELENALNGIPPSPQGEKREEPKIVRIK